MLNRLYTEIWIWKESSHPFYGNDRNTKQHLEPNIECYRRHSVVPQSQIECKKSSFKLTVTINCFSVPSLHIAGNNFPALVLILL